MKQGVKEERTEIKDPYEEKISLLPKKEDDPKTKKLRWFIGIVLLLVVVALWVGGSYIIEHIFEKRYKRPFFVIYVASMSFTVYLFWLIPHTFCKTKKSEERAESDTDTTRSSNEDEETSYATMDSEREEEEGVVEEKPLTVFQVARLGFIFSFLWFIPNYLLALSLLYTSVASNTILSTTVSFFSLIIGYFLGVEEFSIGRLVAVFITLGGVVMITLVDRKNEGGDSLKGNIFAIAQSILLGLYLSLMRKMVKNERLVSMPLLFGFLGLFSFSMFWIVLPILDHFGIEEYSFPSLEIWWWIIFNGVTYVMVDFLWSLVVLFTSPFVASLGMSLAVPTALVVDLTTGKKSFIIEYIIATLLVVLGFIIVNVTTKEKERRLFVKIVNYFKRKI